MVKPSKREAHVVVDAALRREAAAPNRRVNFVPARLPDGGGDGGGMRLVPLNPQAAKQRPQASRGGQAAAASGAADSDSDEDGPQAPPQQELYPESRLRMSWPSVFKVGAGLRNLGNTCFLNAVLQCLTYTPPLALFALAGEHRKFKGSGFSALFAIGEHISEALGSPGRAVAPTAVVRNLRHIARSFRVGRQEDAHEFSRYLIEAMQAACVGSRTLPPGVAETSFVSRVFGGRLRSQIRCACGRDSNTYDPFLDLSLEIVRAPSVDKALRRFCATEVLDGENKYRCEHTKRKVRATKQFSIERAPNVLALQLKRFQYGAFGGKIDAPVAFGPLLDLRPYMSHAPVSEDFSYRLYGVLVHSGRSTHSGHYFAFVRAPGGAWFLLDDERVRQVADSVVMQQKAYMLFYLRQRPSGAAQPAAQPEEAAPEPAPAPAEAAAPERKRKREAAAEAAVPVPELVTSPARSSPRRLRSRGAGSGGGGASPSPRLLHRDSRAAGAAHLLARRRHTAVRRRRRSLPLLAEDEAAAPAPAIAAAPAATAPAKRPSSSAAPKQPPTRVNNPPRAPARVAAEDTADQAALAAALSFPKRWSQFGSDGVTRWDGVDAGTAASADALVRAARPAFKRAAARDDWDEDYDRGKLKKRRAARLAMQDDGVDAGGVCGSNPFTARAQQFAGGRPAAGAKRGAGRERRANGVQQRGAGGRGGRGGGKGRGRGRG